MPAKAGIQRGVWKSLDASFRWHDKVHINLYRKKIDPNLDEVTLPSTLHHLAMLRGITYNV